jgi:hypothetical protein
MWANLVHPRGLFERRQLKQANIIKALAIQTIINDYEASVASVKSLEKGMRSRIPLIYGFSINLLL